MSEHVAVVTGGAVGIGRAIAEALSERGDTVYILDTNHEAGSRTAADLPGGSFINCDVTSKEDIDRAINEIDDAHGAIDVLVNNAGGFSEQKTIESESLEEWTATIDLNLTSVFLMTQAATPLLKKSSRGTIVNISSLAGQLANYRTSPAYAAAKAGVHGLTRVFATELAPHGINVNALSPSAVETDRIRRLRGEAERSATAASIPLGRYQSPQEVADWVLFLTSEPASFTTGQIISVNGGRFMV